MKSSIKFDEGYFLSTKLINAEKTVEVEKKTNHIFVVDVSGSMYYELQLIRTQLKNKLSDIMKDGDTISIIWFSGNKEAGILKEEVEVKSLKTLTDLHNAIDRWLQPVGLTAFLKPLELVKDLVERIKINRPDSVFSMIFLTDGYNNDCPWGDVIKTLKSLENDIAASTFVEYGYYADTRRLTEMAGILGGEKISCDGFDDFEPLFDAKISSSIYGGKKTLVEITDTYLYDFAFSVTNNGVLLYNITDNQILVGSDVEEIHYFTPMSLGINPYVENQNNVSKKLYAAIYVLADKLLNDDAEKIFYALGDNFHYKMLMNSFGKQKLNSFKSSIKACIGDITKRFPEGVGTIEKVDDNAYCLMNLIEDLGNFENCLFYPNHKDFVYNRIGKKKIKAATVLSESEKKRLSEAKNVAEANNILKELEEKKVNINFKNSNPNMGYPIKDIVWNSSRANLSVLVRMNGEVELPANKFGIDKVSSFKYNTFTLIRDGILNVTKLPVLYSTELEELLVKNNVPHEISTEYNAEVSGTTYGKTVVIDLTTLPIINRSMVKSVSAKVLAEKEWNLLKLKADKKVYDYFKNTLYPKTSKSYAEMLGQECADWLKEIGVTDYNGFAPKVVTDEAKDFYMSVNLDTKFKGLSSLPKVDVVLKAIKENKKLKISEWIMSDAILNYNAQTQSDMFLSLNEEQQKGVLKSYLETKSDMLNKKRRKLMQEIAEIKFALILSKKWFIEFNGFDDNQLQLVLDKQPLTVTFDMRDKEEEI